MNSVNELWVYLPWLLALLCVSGFFSGSEAAFFSLTPAQRRGLSKATPADRLVTRLLSQSERLLMGILFWNLAINIAYFSVVSKLSLAVSENAVDGRGAVVSFTALLVIIVFGEFLPKSLAVTYPVNTARGLVFPLSVAIRLVSIFLPTVRVVNEASRRLLWPGFQPESYLEHADLSRAVELSTQDAELYEQESQVLRNVIRLSEIRVEEWMRPRTQYRTFRPPVRIEDLGGEKTPSGYMLITDSLGREIVSAIDVSSSAISQPGDLMRLKQPLVVVPWCATIADAMAKLRVRGLRVAAVVNEFGETIGILTWEEIVDAILQSDTAHSHRELAKAEIHPESDGVWIATGLTKLRRLERVLGCQFATGRSLTIGGVIQERLHRLPELGDCCNFEGVSFEVVDAGLRGEILVRVVLPPTQETSE